MLLNSMCCGLYKLRHLEGSVLPENLRGGPNTVVCNILVNRLIGSSLEKHRKSALMVQISMSTLVHIEFLLLKKILLVILSF